MNRRAKGLSAHLETRFSRPLRITMRVLAVSAVVASGGCGTAPSEGPPIVAPPPFSEESGAPDGTSSPSATTQAVPPESAPATETPEPTQQASLEVVAHCFCQG